jgi:hypothetical protein
MSARNSPEPWIRSSIFLSGGNYRFGSRDSFGAGRPLSLRNLVTGKMDPYSVLGLTKAADAKQIKLGYLAKVFRTVEEVTR